MMNFIEKWFKPLVLGLLVLIFISDRCSTRSLKRNNENTNKSIKNVEEIVTDIDSKTLTKEQMNFIIENSIMWETLRIEEISDKHNTPINELKIKKEED